MNDNDAEIMELVDEVRRCERAVQQAKNALEVAKRDAAVAACPYKEGDLVSGWDRDGTSPAKVDKILRCYRALSAGILHTQSAD